MSELRFYHELPLEEGSVSSSRSQYFNGDYYSCGHAVWETRNGLAPVHCPKCKELK